jgi:hypothetical protein
MFIETSSLKNPFAPEFNMRRRRTTEHENGVAKCGFDN